MIACFPAGGGTDIAARMINTQLGEALGKPVIVENRGGAGGNIGIAAVARAPPDGYTLLVCSSAFVVNPSLYAKATYDPFKDFIPIMVIGASPNVFVVPAQSEIKSMPELIAKAKANPGKLNWASPAPARRPISPVELLQLRTGTNMVHIPFAGAGPATQAAVAGQVDLYTANIGSLQGLIDGGKLRPIAVTSKQRWPTFPMFHRWRSSASRTPSPTPSRASTRRRERRSHHRSAGEGAHRHPRSPGRAGEIRQGRPAGGGRGPEAFRARIAREVPMYKEIIDKAGLKIQ